MAINTDSIGNILIRGVNWVGDAVMTLPALKAIRKAFPNSKISLLVNETVAPIFEGNPNIDEIILYKREHKGILGKLRLSGILREKKFSTAILLQNAFDAAIIAFFSGIPKRIGYKRDGRGFLLTDPIPYDREDRSMHHIDYFLELLRKSGISAERSEPWIYLRLDERLTAREMLSNLKRPVIGINPGAAYGSAKQWPPAKFASTAEKIINELDGSVVIFGSENEKNIAEEIMNRLSAYQNSAHLLSMAGKTTLRELAFLISECDVLLTNDSGPMHIGYAVKAPLVAIFGSTDPELTGPIGKNTIVIKKNMPCSPCFERECRDKTTPCMSFIEPNEVFNAVTRLIPKKKAVIFDRDGTLCWDANYLSSWEQFKVFPDVIEVNLLFNKGYLLIGATNQSGIARGIIEESFVRDVNRFFMEKYNFTDFYYCPHHPDERCSCRKPEPGMAVKAREEHMIDFKQSFVVGDNKKDILLAKSIGAKAVLVKTGGVELSDEADFIAADLRSAIEWILKNSP